MLRLTIAPRHAAAPQRSEDSDVEVQARRISNATVASYRYSRDGQHWIHFPTLADFCFDPNRDEVIAIAHDGSHLDAIWDAYYRSVLPMALQTVGQEVLHASAVQTPRGVLAFCADSETGKSTIAYGLSLLGYPICADDAVAIETRDERIYVAPLPFKVRLRVASASFFGLTQQTAPATTTFCCNATTDRTPVPLAAVCVLRRMPEVVDGIVAESVHLSPVQAFMAVLPHAYCPRLGNLEERRRMIQRYLNLTSQVPVFETRFQPGFQYFPTVLTSIIQMINSES